MGVQLSTDFNVTVNDVAIDAADRSHVVYSWDITRGAFKPATSAEITPFHVDSPLLLRKSDDSLCQTGQGQVCLCH